MSRLHYRQELNPVARRLRSEMTPAELKLWMHIRRKQLLGVQFLRQRPIGAYVVDFLAPVPRLVIEVDGGQHFESRHEARDIARDQYLLEQGYRMLRFTNTQVLKETPQVLEVIYQAIEEIRNPPQPPFKKGGRITPPNPRPAPFAKGGRAQRGGISGHSTNVERT